MENNNNENVEKISTNPEAENNSGIKKPDSLVKAGLILTNIIYGISCISIIGLAWAIPGFIMNGKIFKGQADSTVGAGVLGIIFGGIIFGFFILLGKYE